MSEDKEKLKPTYPVADQAMRRSARSGLAIDFMMPVERIEDTARVSNVGSTHRSVTTSKKWVRLWLAAAVVLGLATVIAWLLWR